MAPKSCRHASQALRLADFRRALRHHDALGCEMCAVPLVRGNSRSKTGSSAAKRGRRSPQSPEEAAALGDSTGSSRGGSSGSEALSPAETLKGWAPNPAWEDLYICVTCGHMGCLGKNHFMLHFQIQPKHFIGFHVASRTFFCCPCKQEVEATKGRVQDMVTECSVAFEEIAGKQQRRVKNKLATNPTALSMEEEDEYPDSSRSYVHDSETRRGLDLTELRAMLEADDDDAAESIVNGERSSPVGNTPPRVPAIDMSNGIEAVETVSVPVDMSAVESPTKPVMKTPHSVLGFSNLGNTCYFNAATQALLTSLHYFPEYTYDDEVIVRIVDSPVAATLMMLHQTIIQKTRNLPLLSADKASPVSDARKSRASSSKNKTPPKPVLTVAPLLKEMRKKFTQFRGNYQQDAHELFTSLLWAIDEEIDPPQLHKTEKSDPSDSEQKHQSNELVNVFVKTDSGETLSLRVSPDASMDEIQAMLAKKLSLDDREVFLQPSGGRLTMTRRTTMHTRQSPASYSKVNFVRTLFGGALTTEVQCKACGNCSETVEDAFQLSLPIPANPDGKYVTVKDCLQYFTVETHLRVDSETGYECEKCSRPPKSVGGSRPPSPSLPAVLRDASMRMRISELPRVLVLHLKRLGRLRKITQHIQFDAMLDMAPHVDDDVLERHESTMYELIAVVVHKGNKRAGHYVSYVSRKNMSSSTPKEVEKDEDQFTKTTRSTLWTLEDPDHDWFYVSDSLVQSVAFDQVLKCEAYMLFYQRVAPATINSPRYTEHEDSERETERDSELAELRDTVASYPDRDTSCWI